jgi:hypothetical protein
VEELVELSATIRDKGSRWRRYAPPIPKTKDSANDMPYPNAPLGKVGQVVEKVLEKGKTWHPPEEIGSTFSRKGRTGDMGKMLMDMAISSFASREPGLQALLGASTADQRRKQITP